VVGRRSPAGGPITSELVQAGFYGPGSEAWRLNREAMLLLGAGPRALLLQLAHPLVAEGVDRHSDFRADPWSRLAATLRSYLRIVYGTAPEARAEIERLNGLHGGIRGVVRDPAVRERHGSRYHARDPAPSLWVHATLVDSTIAAYDAWIEPLSDERRARFYEETLPVGRAFGIPADLLPSDIEAFDAYIEAMLAPGGGVEVGPLARDLATTVLHPPLGPAVAAFGGPASKHAPWLVAIPAAANGWPLWPSLGLLPPAIREGYELSWGIRERLVSGWLVSTWRAWRPFLPTTFRQMPQALAADRRIGAGDGGSRDVRPAA
jgi:uncharacterized protein (DUF2236 family)